MKFISRKCACERATFGSKLGFHFGPPYPCLVLSTTYKTAVFGSRPKVGDDENKALTRLSD